MYKQCKSIYPPDRFQFFDIYPTTLTLWLTYNGKCVCEIVVNSEVPVVVNRLIVAREIIF